MWQLLALRQASRLFGNALVGVDGRLSYFLDGRGGIGDGRGSLDEATNQVSRHSGLIIITP